MIWLVLNQLQVAQLIGSKNKFSILSKLKAIFEETNAFISCICIKNLKVIDTLIPISKFCKKDNISELEISKFITELFDIEGNHSKADLEILVEMYKIMDLNVKKTN